MDPLIIDVENFSELDPSTHFENFLASRTNRLEQFLNKFIYSKSLSPSLLERAIHYSVFNGGKRLRPILVYMTGEALGVPLNKLDAAAAAVELIHCYSLIHDDLPAMDDDDLRRGKPSCHKAFDEATAILAGDALQTLAFQILSDSKLNPISPNQQIFMINTLAKKSGREGMVGGQALDIAAEGKSDLLDLEELRQIHQKKTGALIEASVLLGAIPANREDNALVQLQNYARFIGLSFQVQDDILDIEGSPENLGKTPGKDQQQSKATFPALLGMEGAKQYAQNLHAQAVSAIDFLGEKGRYLAKLSEYFIARIK
jgi:farnesyl diphosphate synthase